MHSKNRYFETEIIGFTVILFLIVLLAQVLNLFTVSGWTALLYLFALPAIFACFLVLLIVSAIIKSNAKRPLVWVDKYYIYALIPIQLFVILFSSGDCGDNSNQVGNFIQRILTKTPECFDYSLNPWIPGSLVLGLYVLNLFFIAVFTLKTLASAHPKNPDLK
jgi:hypothetical protein